jgi:hypothetical protein
LFWRAIAVNTEVTEAFELEGIARSGLYQTWLNLCIIYRD